MKRLYNFMLAVLPIVMLSACGKRTGMDSSADKALERYVRTEIVETTGQAGQEQAGQEQAGHCTGSCAE